MSNDIISGTFLNKAICTLELYGKKDIIFLKNAINNINKKYYEIH